MVNAKIVKHTREHKEMEDLVDLINVMKLNIFNKIVHVNLVQSFKNLIRMALVALFSNVEIGKN